MKKIYTQILVLFLVNSIIAQTESKSLVLSKVLNSNELANRLTHIREIKSTTNPNQPNSSQDIIEKDLYKKMSEVYQGLFTPEEISNMLIFYNSALGKKILENQQKIDGKTRSIIMNWEMKQQGISLEETIEPSFENEEQILAFQKKEREKNILSNKTQIPKIIKIPKITNLEELKKLIIKNPNLMDDPLLFEEILGKQEFEKLYNSK